MAAYPNLAMNVALLAALTNLNAKEIEMSDNTLLDLDAMLNDSLDNIADVPDFMNPPVGEYRLSVKDCAIDKYETKKEPGVQKQRMKFTYAIIETISVAGSEPPAPDGTLFTETFMATEQGLSFFKKRIKDVMGASDVAGVTLGDMMNSVKGQEFTCRLTIKKTKGADGTEYENIQIRVVKV